MTARRPEVKKLALFLAAMTVVVGCSQDDKKTKKPEGNARNFAQCTGDGILVADETGTALAGAQVLIGDAVNSPFSGNFLTSDANGFVARPAGWTMPATVTAQANGFVRTTYFARTPGSCLTMTLNKPAKVPTLELSGETTKHPSVDKDGFLEFGLVISALTRNDVLGFDINKVISTQVDTISVMGQSIEIPSNVTVPKQTENYILPITIEKPAYRLYFGDKGQHKVFAAQGRFPFKKVIDEVRAKKKFYELINDFSITGGVVRDLSPSRGVNLPVNELAFTAKKNFKAPAMNSKEILIALAVSQMNGYMVPTDVKRIESNQTMGLATYSKAPAMAVGVLKNEDEFQGTNNTDRLSAVMLPLNTSVNPTFLALIPNPRRVGADLQMTPPKSVGGVNELATLAVLSDVKELQMGKNTLPFLIHNWEVYAPSWVDKMDLPTWPASATDVPTDADPSAQKKRWEVTFLGSELTNAADLGQPTIEAATHVTHSSVDF